MEFNISDIIHKNISGLLNEGRLEDVKSKYPESAESSIDDLSERDPSGNNKYLAWMAKQAFYTKNEIINSFGDDDWYMERYGRRSKVNKDDMLDLVTYFHQYPHKYEKKDINQYGSLKELEEATETAKTKLSRKEVKDQGGEKVYEDDNFVLIHPKTHEASCKYGSRTKWCVTMRGYTGYFERYSTHGPLFFLIDKRRLEPTRSMRTPDYYKIALHYQPRIGGRIMIDKRDFAKRAMNQSREQFVNSADIANSRLDFWNVQDKNVAETTVLKYLGGPGRGQKERGTTALHNLKTAMERYTKKLLGDYWDMVHTDNTAEIEERKSELKRKISKLSNKRDYYWDVHERLDNTIYHLNQLGDEDLKSYHGVEDSEDLIQADLLGVDITDEKIEQLKNKRSQFQDAASELDNEINELNGELESLQQQTRHEFAFYDLAKNVPQS
jgi:hypothetical protein